MTRLNAMLSCLNGTIIDSYVSAFGIYVLVKSKAGKYSIRFAERVGMDGFKDFKIEKLLGGIGEVVARAYFDDFVSKIKMKEFKRRTV